MKLLLLSICLLAVVSGDETHDHSCVPGKMCKDQSVICLFYKLKQRCHDSAHEYFKLLCPYTCGECVPCKQVYRHPDMLHGKDYDADMKVCKDTITYCHMYFLNRDQCEQGTGKDIAKTQCRKFCGLCNETEKACSTDCKDAHPECFVWAKKEDHCHGYQEGWMMRHCPKSCGYCRPCTAQDMKTSTKPKKVPTTTATTKPKYRPTTTPKYRPKPTTPKYKPRTTRPKYRPTTRPKYRPTTRPKYRPTTTKYTRKTTTPTTTTTTTTTTKPATTRLPPGDECIAECKDGTCTSSSEKGSCMCDKTGLNVERPRCRRGECEVACLQPDDFEGEWQTSCTGVALCTCISRAHPEQGIGAGALCR